LSSPSASISVSPAEQESWRAGYEAQVSEWRQQSAGVRARAEAERARWEELRKLERAEQARLQQQQQQQGQVGYGGGGDGGVARGDSIMSVSVSATSASSGEWEAVSQRSTSAGASAPASSTAVSASPPDNAPGIRSAPSDSRQSSEPQRPQTLPRSTSSPSAPAPRSATGQQQQPLAGTGTGTGTGTTGGDLTDSPHWENLPSSPTSSFPSMSFPEPSRSHSPEHLLHAPAAARTTTTTTTTTPPAAHPAPAASATLAVFDGTLPIGMRFWALVSSLSINMFLPFVNGVMLGFGEIFAKTVIVGWLGWGPTVATNLGLGVRSRNR